MYSLPPRWGWGWRAPRVQPALVPAWLVHGHRSPGTTVKLSQTLSPGMFHVKHHPLSRRGASTTTTRVGVSTYPSPMRTTSGVPTPSRRRTLPDRSTSCSADCPLMASTRPCSPTSGKVQPSSLSRGATALAVTTSKRLPLMSSARSLATCTLSWSSSEATASVKNVARRSSGSMSVTWRSGRASAQTRPGNPAPDPTSATLLAMGTSPGSGTTTTAQFTRCRSQSLGTSRGPIRPWLTPSVAKRSW